MFPIASHLQLPWDIQKHRFTSSTHIVSPFNRQFETTKSFLATLNADPFVLVSALLNSYVVRNHVLSYFRP